MWSGRRLGPCGLPACRRRRPPRRRRPRRRHSTTATTIICCNRSRRRGAAPGPGSGRCARPSTSSTRRRRRKCASTKTRSGRRRTATNTAEGSGSRPGPDRLPGPTRRPACCPLPLRTPLGNATTSPSSRRASYVVSSAAFSNHNSRGRVFAVYKYYGVRLLFTRSREIRFCRQFTGIVRVALLGLSWRARIIQQLVLYLYSDVCRPWGD